jgi:APA family basic amino acid/polyamine antiporter
LSGWTSFIAGFSGAIAAGAVGLATYLGHYIPPAADNRPLLVVPLLFANLNFSPRTITACLVILLLSAIHVRGVGPGRHLQNALTVLKLLALFFLIVLGFALGRGSVANFSARPGHLAPLGCLLAMVPIMFSYSGWNAASYVAEEIREPTRNVARGLALGTGSVIALYLLLNAVYLYAIPPQKMTGSINTAEVVAEALAGPVGGKLITPVILVVLAGGISAMILAGPRVYFAMGRDGVFPRGIAKVHMRYRTPAVAITAQAIWSIILVLSGSFEQLLLFTGFAVVLFSGLAVLSLFLLRRAHPAQLHTGAWGYPWAPAVFVLLSLAMVANMFVVAPKPSLAGIALIAAGVPVYWLARLKGTSG